MYIIVIKIIIIKLTLTMTFVVFYRNPFETTEGFIEKDNQAQGCKEQEQYENLVKQFLSRCKVLGYTCFLKWSLGLNCFRNKASLWRCIQLRKTLEKNFW